MIAAGIDAGSRAIKIVLLDAQTLEVLASGLADQGVRQEALARALLEDLLARHTIERTDIAKIVATGYGRHLLTFCDRAVTEITCHAAGVLHQIPTARTILEIGGQDAKVVHLTADGSVRDFRMNDRCAAGTGRFLEIAAQRLELDLETFGEGAPPGSEPAAISSMCVVFAESEITGLLASGVAPAAIAAGVQRAIARRIAALAGPALEPPLVLTGGVALVRGMAAALEQATGQPLTLPPEPQMSGALGAALLAAEEARLEGRPHSGLH